MTVDEIKSTYAMTDIVGQYGYKPNKLSFIPCPFHKEKTASMKIFKESYYCFGCGATGDIFTFVQNMDNCDFKTAFYSLGGTYQKPTPSSKLAIYKAKQAKKTRQKKEERLRAEIRHNDLLMGIYVSFMKRLEPLSDAWCDCMNEYEKCLGRDEYLQNKWKGGV